MPLSCGSYTDLDRNAFRSQLLHQTTDYPPAQVSQYRIGVEIGPTAVGPWTDAPVQIGLTDVCSPDPNNRFQFQSALDTIFLLSDPSNIGIVQGGTYFIRYRIYDETNTLVPGALGEIVCGPHTTPRYPDTLACLGVPKGSTSIQLEYGIAGPPGATFNLDSPCNRDQVQWTYADNPGFFSPTVLPFEPVNSLAPSKTISGLTPCTDYYFVAKFRDVNGVEFLAGPICGPVTTDGIVWCGTAIPCSVELVFVANPPGSWPKGTWRPASKPWDD